MIKLKKIALFTAAALLIASCNFPLFAGPREEEADTLATAVAMTVQAMETQPPVQPTATPLPTITPQLTNTVSAPPTAAPQPCDKTVLVTETIPDGTQFSTDESFIKTWTLKNIGTCTWNTNYKLVFVEGESMSGPVSVALPETVAPNGQTTIEVGLKAPAKEGTYRGYWQLRNDSNQLVGDVWVDIKVSTQAFSVTSVYTNLIDMTETCPHPYGVDVSIQANGAGTVSYSTETSEGAASPVKTVTFNEAGTKVVEFDWEFTSTGAYWLKVFIKTPNNQVFGPFNFNVTCN